jgi:exosortase/archaeosortase family protein
VTAHVRAVVLRVVVIVAISLLGFAFGQSAARHFEALASNALVQLVAGNRSFVTGSYAVGVLPDNHTPFTAIITPSCSALASVLAILALATVTGRHQPGRQFVAAVGASTVIVVGNLVRIATSIGMGLLFGRSSLVLFHDWVGGLMTFVYTLGGYTLMLFVLLPRVRPGLEPASASVEEGGLVLAAGH